MRKTILSTLLVGSALIVSASVVEASQISWNGFGSAYYSQALKGGFVPLPMTDTSVQFTKYSLFGLNLESDLSRDLGVAAQIVGLGDPIGSNDSFGLIAQWAFLKYRPMPGVLLKAGRQLFPVLMGSEYVRVGYLLPFRQYPAAVFLAPFTRFDGIAANHTVDFGVGTLTYGLFLGSPLVDLPTSVTGIPEPQNLLGAHVTFEGDGWLARAMASRFYQKMGTSNFQVPCSDSNFCQGNPLVYSLGGKFDKDNILLWSEYLVVQTPDGTQLPNGRFLGSAKAFYVLGGYRFGNFMPKYMFNTSSENYFNAPHGFTQHTFGINYQAGKQAVVKLEFEYSLIPTVAEGSFMFVSQPAGGSYTSGKSIFAGVDFIF